MLKAYCKMGWIETVGWIRTKLNWQFLLILTTQCDSKICLVLMMILVIYCCTRTWLNKMNLCSVIFIFISIFPKIHIFVMIKVCYFTTFTFFVHFHSSYTCLNRKNKKNLTSFSVYPTPKGWIGTQYFYFLYQIVIFVQPIH